MTIKKFTPILLVDSVAECLPFWEKRLGYEVATKVPHGGEIGFVILKLGESEVMLQSRASLREDLPTVTQELSKNAVLLYADVDSLDDIEKALKGATILVPRRKTFYGAYEIWIKEPSGNVIGFAEFSSK